MAAIFQIKRGTSNITIADGELYLHKGSGSIQFGSGSNNPITLLPLNVPSYGDINLIGNISASGDVRVGGNIYLGNASADNISALGQFNTNLVPNGAIDVGTTSAYWRNVYATNISGAIAATNGVVSGSSQIVASLPQGTVSGSSQIISILDSLNTFSGSQLSQNISLATITGSLIVSASNAKSTNDSQAILITNLNTFSGSQLSQNSSLATITGSLISTASNHEQRLDAFESESGSYARINRVNSFVGNQIITGSLITSGSDAQFNITWPASGTEKHIVKTNAFTVDNRQYGYSAIALEHYEGAPNVLHNAMAMYMFDPTDTYGSLISVGPYRTQMQMFPSGSGGNLANISVQDLNDGTTQALVYGDYVQIGAAHAESIIIGNSGSVVEISGSIKAAQLNAIATVTGSLIASASSFESRNASLATITGSLISTASANTILIAGLNSYTSSLRAAITASGTDVTINGNLTVKGTTTQIDSTTLNIGDNIIELNYGGSQTVAGIYTKDATGTLTSGSLLWNSTIDRWTAGASGSESRILLAGGDGILSGSTDFSTFSTSVNSRLTNLETTSASVSSSIGNINSTTASLSSSVGDLNNATASLYTSASLMTASIASLTSSVVALQSFSGNVNTRFNNLQTYTTSVDGRFATLATYTGSVNTKLTEIGVVTASLITSASNDAVLIANLNTFSGSQNSKDVTLATYTGSVEGRFTTLASVTASYDGRFTSLATISGSLISSASSFQSRFATIETVTSSLESRATEIGIVTASLISSASSFQSRLGTIGSVTASLEGRFSTLAQVTSSIHQFTSSLNTYTVATEIRLDDLEYTASISVGAGLAASFAVINQFTSSQLTQNSNLAIITGSLITSASNLTQRVGAIEAVSGTFARTNSTNTFNGTQTISGSLYVTQDLVILGSSSIQNVSSSTLNIGTNLITVAVNQPSVRFGGIAVIDSGSSGASGSLLYDSVQDEFIFVHRGNGTNVTSSHFILGPETIDNLGNETYLTNNRLPKGSGKEHLNDSNITDTGTLITLGSNSVVNGTFYATGITLVSGSSQITYSGLSGIPAGIVSGSSQLSSILPAGTVSGSSQVIGILSSLNTYTGSNDTLNTTQNSRLDQLSTASGSAITRLTALEVETSNLETFSSSALTRLTALEVETANLETFTSSINTTIKSKLDADGVISGSLQIVGILSSLNSYTQSNDTTNNTQNSRLDQLSTASGSAITRLTALEVETANLESFSSSALTRLTALEVETANLESFTSSINTTIKTRLNVEGVVSGSSQIDLTATTNYASGILTRLNAVGVVSGSSQINLGSATGNIALATQTTGDYVASLVQGTGVAISNNSGENATPTIAIGQAVGTSANVQFNSIGVGTTASGVGGEIRATGDIVAFFSSDERLKENIQPIENALQKVNQISGNTYDWKEGFETIHSHKGTDVGVIAQEIEEVLPQAVVDRETGYKAVNYEKIVPLLIEAIKQLSAKIDSLENK